MALTVHDLRSAIEANAKVNIGWWGSAKDCDGMRLHRMLRVNARLGESPTMKLTLIDLYLGGAVTTLLLWGVCRALGH